MLLNAVKQQYSHSICGPERIAESSRSLEEQQANLAYDRAQLENREAQVAQLEDKLQSDRTTLDHQLSHLAHREAALQRSEADVHRHVQSADQHSRITAEEMEQHQQALSQRQAILESSLTNLASREKTVAEKEQALRQKEDWLSQQILTLSVRGGQRCSDAPASNSYMMAQCGVDDSRNPVMVLDRDGRAAAPNLQELQKTDDCPSEYFSPSMRAGQCPGIDHAAEDSPISGPDSSKRFPKADQVRRPATMSLNFLPSLLSSTILAIDYNDVKLAHVLALPNAGSTLVNLSASNELIVEHVISRYICELGFDGTQSLVRSLTVLGSRSFWCQKHAVEHVHV